jgi:hypothetical protein
MGKMKYYSELIGLGCDHISYYTDIYNEDVCVLCGIQTGISNSDNCNLKEGGEIE